MGGSPTHNGGGVSRSKVAKDAGLSQRQKETALRVANVDADEFERLVESDAPPTVTARASESGPSEHHPTTALAGAPVLDPVRRTRGTAA